MPELRERRRDEERVRGGSRGWYENRDGGFLGEVRKRKKKKNRKEAFKEEAFEEKTKIIDI